VGGVAEQGAACDGEVEAATDQVAHDGGTVLRRKIQVGDIDGVPIFTTSEKYHQG
jgi:uncharacterized protein (DUF779 family)